MNLPFKTCPRCGVEYVATALVCSDCNVALEALPIGGREPPATASLPPASELTRIAAGGPWEMERLALELQEAGISCRIDAMPSSAPISRHVAGAPPRGSYGTGARLALYVLPAEEELARGVIQGILVEDGAGGAARARVGEALDACPACGAAIAPTASACPECGLEFVPVEGLCASCGAVLAAEATACPTCGAEQRGDGTG